MRFVVVLLISAAPFLVSCVAVSGTDLCEEAAANQCDLWRSCFCADGACTHDGTALAEGTCEETLSDSCIAQASTLELPAEDVEPCVEELDNWTCADVWSADVQGRDTSPQSCVYYF